MAQLERFPKPLPLDAAFALRVEGQSSTPEEFAMVKDIVVSTQGILEAHYGKYMDQAAIQRNVNLAERFVITHDLEEVQQGIEGVRKTVRNLREGERIRGISDSATGIIYMSDPSELWKASEYIRGLYLKAFPDEEKARQAHRVEILRKFAVHESGHQYQVMTVSRAFGELGACYYEQDVCATLQLERLEYLGDRLRSEAYNWLLAKYGESIHSMSFGMLSTSELQHEIERDAKHAELVISTHLRNSTFKDGMV